MWAALDCPGAFAFGRDDKPLVLGTLAVKIKDTLVPGERCVVTGWPRGQEGRKFYSGTAIFGEDGRLIAVGRAIWIELDQDSEMLASRKKNKK